MAEIRADIQTLKDNKEQAVKDKQVAENDILQVISDRYDRVV